MRSTIKHLFILASMTVVLFLVAPNIVEAQKKATKTNRSTATAPAGKCSVVVRNDLLPNRVVVVVGCDSADFSTDGSINNGIVVLDEEFNPIFKWKGCSACGWFSRFAGSKKVKGHNALFIELDGRVGTVTVPLYFDGKKFTFAGN